MEKPTEFQCIQLQYPGHYRVKDQEIYVNEVRRRLQMDGIRREGRISIEEDVGSGECGGQEMENVDACGFRDRHKTKQGHRNKGMRLE